MKKKLPYLILVFIMIVFVLLPSRTSNLYLRIYFDEIAGDFCTLYYSTDNVNVFCLEQHQSSAIDYDRMMVEFCLDPSLAGHITGLRLDFPNTEQLLCVNNITVSGGGVIKHQYNPCTFFADENISFSHNIGGLTLIPSRARAYVSTSPEESYVILSDGLCRQIADSYSHYRPTKALVCLFLLACAFLARKKIFRYEPLPHSFILSCFLLMSIFFADVSRFY